MVYDKPEYRKVLYQDDNDKYWWVKLRLKTIVIGGFEIRNEFENRALEDFGFAKFPYAQKQMRYISLKQEDGKILYVPCAQKLSINYISVGQVIEVPARDASVYLDPEVGGWTRAKILARFGERIGSSWIPDDGSFDTPV